MNANKTMLCECTVIHTDTVNKLNEKMPAGDSLARLADLYKNFADTTRVKILWALSVDEICVCDLAAAFEMSVSAVSHQLKILRMSNLIKFRKAGKVVYYSLADDHVKSILLQGFEHCNE